MDITESGTLARPAPLTLAASLGALLTACGGGAGAESVLPPAMADLASAKPQPMALGDPALRAPLNAALKEPQAANTPLDATGLMNWAQTAYPQHFPGNKANLIEAPYIYRYYPETRNYLGVAGNDIYILGPVSGGPLAYVGKLSDFTCTVTSCTRAPSSAPDAARFLAQATLGYTKAEVTALQAGSYAGWLDAQLALPQGLSHWDWLVSKGFDDEAFRNNQAGLDPTIWRKLIAAGDPLRQRMVLALSEILVVSVNGINAPFRQFCLANYLDILDANAFGNYRTLLGQVTLSTAMGYYLTYRGNVKANAAGSQPDENYAREVMQLFTIGLLQLNPDGTPAGGETYTADDVSQLARVFTGWDLDTTGLAQPLPSDVHRRPMAQVGNRYETGSKTFLGVTIAAGTPAATALNIALDTLFNHRNVPPFISRQLIQRLVTSNPSPAYVARVAAVFANNGGGVRGDLKAVLRAILLDIEARDPANLTSTTFGKLREPVQRFLNWARAFGAVSAGDGWGVGDLSDAANRLGQSPLHSGSVFNFFRPGYVPPNSAIASAGLAAPEFQITTESSVAGYVNFMQRAIGGQGIGDTTANYASLLPLVADSAALLNEINLVLAASQVSDATLATLKTALDTISVTTDAGKQNRIQAAITLLMACPEYITQK